MSVLVETKPTEDGSGALSITLERPDGKQFTVIVANHIAEQGTKKEENPCQP